MNSRGLDLSATDILKAEIIGAVDTNQRNALTEKWETIEAELGRKSFDDLFGHIRMIYRKAKPKGTLLREFQDHVSKGRTPHDLIMNVITPLSRRYGEILEADLGGIAHLEKANHHLRWLNRLEFSDWIPPALLFVVDDSLNTNTKNRFFGDLERLAYAMLICRWGVNDRIERFSKLTKEIEEKKDLFSEGSTLQLTASERSKFLSVLDGPIYEFLSARACSAVLLRLDDLVSGGGATYDYPVISVEHVMPQNPPKDSEWLTWMSSEVERQNWMHRLGNLVLLTRRKNSSASNYEFKKKKQTYFMKDGVCPFPLTTQVLQYQIWNSTVIKKRHVELIQRCKSHWRLS